MLEWKSEGKQKEGSRPEGGNVCRKKNVPPYRCQPVLMIGIRGADWDYTWRNNNEIAVCLAVK